MEMTGRKRWVVLGAVVLVLVGAGIALAAYLSSGEGTGAVASTTSADSVISPSNPGTTLYPGASTTFTVSLTNPNPYPVSVVSIAAGSSRATSGGCPAGTVTSAASSSPSGVIPAGGTGTYSLNATMAKNPDNSCQGQAFVLPLTAQLASAAS